MLDDGRLTDGQGRTVDFKNTVIIMTSNLGSEFLADGLDYYGEISDGAKEGVEALLKQSFRPEFLNRLSSIVYFKPLSRAEVERIAALMLKKLESRLMERLIRIELTDAAKNYLVEGGYDPSYGARPMKRFIEEKLESMLAREMIADKIRPNSTVKIDSDGEKLFIS